MNGLFDPDGRMIGRAGLPFTDEQAAAIARREGPLLLSANAGSGKTSVLAERFVRSVLEDGLEPGRILAISFTEKAAGELRARIRGRFVELGARERARDLEAAWISTFHGFCARSLRAHAVRAGLDPAFAVLDEADARAVRAAAFETALAGLLAGERPAALDLVAAYGVDALRGLIGATHDQLRSAGMTRPSLPAVAVASPDRTALAAALSSAQDELAAGGDERRSVVAARAALAAGRVALDAAAPSLPALEKAAFKPGNTRALRGDACAAYLDALEAYRSACEDALAAEAVQLLDELLGRYADAYAAGKRARSALDFDDLELCARDLLAGTPAIRASYRERFTRIMVDEFQDTNAVQLELLELLGGPRFVVGDELQSIYGFRHADVRIFRSERVTRQAEGAAAELARNFRSLPPILSVLDDAFGALHGVAHVPFAPGRTAPAPPGGPLVELLLTDVAAAADWPTEALATLPAATLGRRAEARTVAARVAMLVGEEGVAPGDVVVLLRSVADVAVYERALEERGLSTLSAGGGGYWGRQQVLDLCAYLAVLANPRDELALFGVLASPLVGASADALAILARHARRGERWDALEAAFRAARESTLPEELSVGDRVALERFRSWLAAERAAAPRRGLDELLERIIERTGYDLHVLGLPGGRRRWANVLKLQRLAASFEGRRGRDLRGLIDLATAELGAEAREADAPVELGDVAAVRLMTIHAAKGLEFPVVVVADLSRGTPRDAPDLLVDGDRVGLRLRTVEGYTGRALGWEEMRERRLIAEADEERRILHVAMTRAQDRLLLSGAFDPGCWLAEPRPGVAPVRWLAPRLAPSLLTASDDDAPPDGDEHFLDDPDVRRSGDAGRVRVHVSREPPRPPEAAPGTLSVEALGPGHATAVSASSDGGSQLTLDLEPPAPASASSVAPAALSYSQLAAFDRCAYRWYVERRLRLPRDVDDPLLALGAPSGPAAVGGLEARLRGTIVHELLETLPLATATIPDDAAIRAAGARHALALDDGQVADVRALVAAFVNSPLRERLAAATDVRREHGFVVALGDEEAPLLTGFIDVLAFEASRSALVIDYKTDGVGDDADLEAIVEAEYGTQRRIYALAALGAGAVDVEVVHVFLARPDAPAVAVYDRAAVPRLRAALGARIAAMTAGDLTPSPRPHRGLCAGCPARRSLCHHPDALTSRAEPGSGRGADR